MCKWLRTQYAYGRYVFRHRWFVFQAARRLGVPWLGLLHDLSKFDPKEWTPYVERFYGRGQRPDGTVVTEAELPADVKFAYDYAWLMHQKRNKHHPMYWLTHFNTRNPVRPDRVPGDYEALPMPERYVREMLADWDGARRAGAEGAKRTTAAWYEANGAGLPLHPQTRALVERLLPLLEDGRG